jgi:hypothetical protein
MADMAAVNMQNDANWFVLSISMLWISVIATLGIAGFHVSMWL